MFAIALTLTALTPVSAKAFSLWETLSNAVQPVADAAAYTLGVHNLHTPVLTAATNLDPNPAKGGGDITVVDDVALLAESGPEGTIANIQDEADSNGQISLYVVRKGDSLAQIAKMFGVTTNTILWANDLKSSKDIHPGDQLVILPITGVRHTVAKGETLAGIVKKYKGDMAEVLSFNGLSDGAKVVAGDIVVIPDGVEPAVIVASNGSAPTSILHGAGGPVLSGYYLRPIIGGRKTQGLHGYNAVDLGTPVGTPVMAAADGVVTVARTAGYNGGYGEYVAINHPNGTQTVYGHLSSVNVFQGQTVVQGQVIGYSGNTGKSTGAHLHFEIRGAANPF